MTKINRRHLLKTVAATAVCAGVTSTLESKGSVHQPEANRLPSEAAEVSDAWFIARQNRPHTGEHIVDFWSKPFCEISHADYLPAEITRAMLWYEHSRELYVNPQQVLDSVASALRLPHPQWSSQAQYVEHFGGTKSLSTPLGSLIGKKAHRGNSRTAFIAFDSQSYAPMEPDWADILPAFRCCYDRIIGHFHIESRGFRHWKAWLSEGAGGDAFFEHIFIKPASLCDMVILTCPSLIENDINLSARASIPELVGQLVQRFGHLLLDEYSLGAITPITDDHNRNPQVFVLGSVTSTVSQPHVQERDLCRQCELVFGGFGDWDRHYTRPLLIATLADQPSAKIINDQLLGTDLVFVRLCNSERLCGYDPLEPIELITLWPLKMNLHSAAEGV